MLSPAVTTIGAFALLLIAVHAAALGLTILTRHVTRRVLIWLRRRQIRSSLNRWKRALARWPALESWVGARLAIRSFAGLPLLVLLGVLVYFTSLLADLTEEVAEAEEIVSVDAALAEAVAPYRTPHLVTFFKGVTALGSSEGVTLLGLGATALVWFRRRRGLILPMWLTIWGAQLSTWVGKKLMNRPRPDFVLDVIEQSASFPSGHATAAMATFGFIAYAVARELPRWRSRFEVLFWSSILILAIGFSRIFLDVHHASDVAAGLLVGSIWLLAGIALNEWRDERARLGSAD